jgi:hypothetical protein
VYNNPTKLKQTHFWDAAAAAIDDDDDDDIVRTATCDVVNLELILAGKRKRHTSLSIYNSHVS